MCAHTISESRSHKIDRELIKSFARCAQVDNLEDIGALEEYITCSQMILFFLSKGYFRSRNCLREVRTSLDQQKPLVLVQEADPEKGGGALQVPVCQGCLCPPPPLP